ncbi:unnamed protein product [Euphydryas editha]|uniref:Uncharacterized protein n=1 Tax=Euphydryas editha TaxID=104508 RepID=A0AAU9TM35_EUPED|nr:unnamed protein product [Euphydryas editha]
MMRLTCSAQNRRGGRTAGEGGAVKRRNGSYSPVCSVESPHFLLSRLNSLFECACPAMQTDALCNDCDACRRYRLAVSDAKREI